MPEAASGVRDDRASTLEILREPFDLIVVGGGITGAGVAREAARRGIRTLLVEQADFAWGTSSRSSKMVHGGLRYIAKGDVRLTRDALKERERMIREAPYLVERLGYWFGHRRGKFPGPIAFGILCAIYDRLAGIRDRRFIGRDGVLAHFKGLVADGLVGATRYTDSVTDDARLVLRVLDEALADGAMVLSYARVEGLLREGERVSGVRLRDLESGIEHQVRARAVVNATGAWADGLRTQLTGEKKVRPLRGSHLIFGRSRLGVDEALVSAHQDDRRPVFVFPWEGTTVVGTTDLDHRESLDVEASISATEVDYLMRFVNGQFPEAKLQQTDIVSTYAGIRPVVASGRGLDPSQERREHAVWNDNGLVTVTGGKLTTFRVIALDVLVAARAQLGKRIVDDGGYVFRGFDCSSCEALPREIRRRILGRYGFRAAEFVRTMPADELVFLGGSSILVADLRWGARHERVVHLDDLLLRRTRLGNVLPKGGQAHRAIIETIAKAELGWDDARFESEWARYGEIVSRHYGLPHA